jgi:HAD superfamily hydrolase (TIGR01509 family)
MKIKGAIFDMDGTLLDSMGFWHTVGQEYLNKIGARQAEDGGKMFLELGMKTWHKYHVENYGLEKSFEEVKAGIYEIMNQKYATEVSCKPGVIDMLERLSRKGVKMCLATATDRESVEFVLKKLGIDKYFSKIFTSSEVGVGKREPLIYELALEYLGTPKDETYVFEDAYYAMKTAHNAGFKVAGVYDVNVTQTVDEIKSLCDCYIARDDNYNFEIE